MSQFSGLSPRVESLDLGPIKFKLMDEEDGQGWSRSKADAVEIDYRRFLNLVLLNGADPIVPSKDVDKFWHAHILDTRKYASDCDQVFGFFLHHFPYLGSRGLSDRYVLASEFKRSQRLWAEKYGETSDDRSSVCGGSCGAGCGSQIGASNASHKIDLMSRPSV